MAEFHSSEYAILKTAHQGTTDQNPQAAYKLKKATLEDVLTGNTQPELPSRQYAIIASGRPPSSVISPHSLLALLSLQREKHRTLIGTEYPGSQYYLQHAAPSQSQVRESYQPPTLLIAIRTGKFFSTPLLGKTIEYALLKLHTPQSSKTEVTFHTLPTLSTATNLAHSIQSANTWNGIEYPVLVLPVHDTALSPGIQPYRIISGINNTGHIISGTTYDGTPYPLNSSHEPAGITRHTPPALQKATLTGHFTDNIKKAKYDITIDLTTAHECKWDIQVILELTLPRVFHELQLSSSPYHDTDLPVQVTQPSLKTAFISGRRIINETQYTGKEYLLSHSPVTATTDIKEHAMFQLATGVITQQFDGNKLTYIPKQYLLDSSPRQATPSQKETILTISTATITGRLQYFMRENPLRTLSLDHAPYNTTTLPQDTIPEYNINTAIRHGLMIGSGNPIHPGNALSLGRCHWIPASRVDSSIYLWRTYELTEFDSQILINVAAGFNEQILVKNNAEYGFDLTYFAFTAAQFDSTLKLRPVSSFDEIIYLEVVSYASTDQSITLNRNYMGVSKADCTIIIYPHAVFNQTILLTKTPGYTTYDSTITTELIASKDYDMSISLQLTPIPDGGGGGVTIQVYNEVVSGDMVIQLIKAEFDEKINIRKGHVAVERDVIRDATNRPVGIIINAGSTIAVQD